MDGFAALVQWQSRHNRLLLDSRVATGRCGARESGVCGNDPARIRRRRGPRAPLLRTGELVSGRSRPDAFHRVAVRGTEPGAADVPSKHVPGGLDPCVEVVRPGAAVAAG